MIPEALKIWFQTTSKEEVDKVIDQYFNNKIDQELKLTPCEQAYSNYVDSFAPFTDLSEMEFIAGWNAAIEWSAKNATMETTWEGNTGSEYPDDHVDKQSILKGLEK